MIIAFIYTIGFLAGYAVRAIGERGRQRKLLAPARVVGELSPAPAVHDWRKPVQDEIDADCEALIAESKLVARTKSQFLFKSLLSDWREVITRHNHYHDIFRALGSPVARARARLAAVEALRIERALLDEYQYDITLKENQ